MREICTECGNPVMIMKAGSKTEIGTLDMKQIIVYGCLNGACGKCGQETHREEVTLEAFKE